MNVDFNNVSVCPRFPGVTSRKKQELTFLASSWVRYSSTCDPSRRKNCKNHNFELGSSSQGIKRPQRITYGLLSKLIRGLTHNYLGCYFVVCMRTSMKHDLTHHSAPRLPYCSFCCNHDDTLTYCVVHPGTGTTARTSLTYILEHN